jgi:small ligand-binding sensory domain FIST
MGVSIGAGLSTDLDPRVGAIEAAVEARNGLDGRPADLVVVFASGAHLAAPEATLEGVHEALTPRRVVGCGAAGVLGPEREVERGTAVAVWAAALPEDADVETFAAVAEPMDEGVAVTGLPDLAGAQGAILLPDPYTFPTDVVLAELARRAPGVPVLGGLSSARAGTGTGALFLDDRVVEAGAVGVRIDGVPMLPCVSQGAAPIGPELTITAGEGNVILELAGRPAVQALRETVAQLPAHERALLQRMPLIGIVVEPGKPDYVQGDFLVRGLVGVDAASGALAVGALVRPGQVVRLHARDAGSADRDLREALGVRRAALAGSPAGALVFSCNGRGRDMFGVADHDALAVAEELGPIPAAGFFAAGEIGPVGGESFLHGFTATVAVFGA